MSYDPSVGRWTSEDPIGFAAGDVNLYRYVGNGPTNATDPTGLKLVGWPRPIDTTLRKQVSEDERRILDALVKNDLYKKMIKELDDAKLEFDIQIKTGLEVLFEGEKLRVPGAIKRSDRHPDRIVIITIDPKFPYPGYPNGPNPAEIADTILHELMHAVLMVQEPNPLLPGGMDKSHDKNLEEGAQRPENYLDMEYGREPIYPDRMHSDINRALQKRLVDELKKIREQAGVGGPTLTEQRLPR